MYPVPGMVLPEPSGSGMGCLLTYRPLTSPSGAGLVNAWVFPSGGLPASHASISGCFVRRLCSVSRCASAMVAKDDAPPIVGLRCSGQFALADDLDGMHEYLGAQVRRMDEIVDSVENGWQGPTATSYRSLHRGAAEDAVRIGQKVQLLAEAIRMSEGGFTEQELDALERFRALQADVDVEATVDALSTPTTEVPRSRLMEF